jgi:hypothetical protein
LWLSDTCLYEWAPDVPPLLADQLSAMGDGWMLTLPAEPDPFFPHRMRELLGATAT